MSSRSPKILLLTAGYGDGHNSAARGIAQRLEGRADAKIVDMFALAMPRTFKLTRKAYLWMISTAPSLWRALYDWTDSVDMSDEPLGVMYPVYKRLADEIERWEPDLIVCTYMAYPYLLDRFFQQAGYRIPYVTVVTDSIEINKTWVCSQSDAWAVTDCLTKQIMVNRGVEESRVFVSGFPVSSQISELAKKQGLDWKSDEPFRVLFFAQGEKSYAYQCLLSLLSVDPRVHVTCVLGRHVRKYHHVLSPLKKRFNGRLMMKGWTKKVPDYMATHHLVVSKAGGSTSHECIAMKRPIVVNFRMPGQEEGNIELLENLGGGRLVETASDLAGALRQLMKDEGAIWRKMRNSLAAYNQSNGADAIIDWCFEQLDAKGEQ